MQKSTPRLLTSATVKLFGGVPIKVHTKSNVVNSELLKATIRCGFVFAPEVTQNYSIDELLTLTEIVSDEVGLSPEQMNSSFHKSWIKVRDTPIFQLVAEQLVHYVTTYGFEWLGIYDSESVYIPNERLKIPDLKEGIKLTVIRGFTEAQLKDKLMNFLASGVALKEDTLKDVEAIAVSLTLTSKDVDRIKNREAKVILCDHLGLAPEQPEEFLRLMLYKTTGKSLIIINKSTIKAVKDAVADTGTKSVAKFFNQYNEEVGYAKLSEIFLRFKPLFLAFKAEQGMKPIVNKLRKLAVHTHRPMKPDFLNNVTAMIANGTMISVSMLGEELKKANTFRKVRLAYALKYRLSNPESIMYRVRNGKSYATSFKSTIPKGFEYTSPERGFEDAYKIVMESVVNDLRPKVKGKKFYIPNGIKYALPATEKQFTGNIPSGSYVTIPKDMIVGVYWENVDDNRIDLDLSLVSLGAKFGWDSFYRGMDGGILFSGDMTDATQGATELFYLKKAKVGAYIMFVNYFNAHNKLQVPFKVLVAKELATDFTENYMVNPNNVLCVAKTSISHDMKQKTLGLVMVTPHGCRFYFTETALGNSQSSSGKDYVLHARKYLIASTSNPITLNGVLEQAGAVIVASKDKDVVDLSPESLAKDSIITLLSKP